MAIKRIDSITLNELRRKTLDKLREVQYSGEPRLITHFGQVIGKLVPPKNGETPKRPAA